MERRNWKLSPSDFGFLWQECPRCFYLKVARGIWQPFKLPSVFNKIDAIMKEYFTGKTTAEFSPELPPGVVEFGEKWVQSQPIALPTSSSTCFVKGKFDTVVRFEDGSYGVIDFKTTTIKPEHVARYGRQLQAYAYALENASPGKPSLSPVSKLGLLCVEPKRMARTAEGDYSYLAAPAWLECPRDDEAFLSFLGEVVKVLDRPEPPPAGEDCDWCKYRETARRINL